MAIAQTQYGQTPIQNESYNPNTWKAGDVVTSAKLNKIEQGIVNAGGAFVVNDIDGHLDKTWQEIYEGNYYFIVRNEYIRNGINGRLISDTKKYIYLINEVGIKNKNEGGLLYYVDFGEDHQKYGTVDVEEYPQPQSE